jgi:SulP family sulfate permease
MASSVEVREATEQEIRQEFSHLGMTRLPPGVLAYAVEGPFFFGAVDAFERALAQARADPAVLIIRLRWVPFIDITGLQALEEAIADLQRRGVRVMICGANPRVHGKLERAGLVALVGEGGYFPDFGAALQACHRLAESDPEMARKRAALLSETAETPPRGEPSA